MRITLTGATGFIGTRLVKRLLADRHELTILSRQPRAGTVPRYLVWNAAQQDPPAEALDRCEAVIHLAGEPVAQRWSVAVKAKIRASRIASTQRLVRAMAAASDKPRVLVSASAIGIYGSRGEEVLTEKSAPGHGFLEDVTADWEREASAARKFGTRVVPVRIGIVLGEGGALQKMLPPFRAGVGGNLGSGRQWMSWVHVDDLVDLIVYALAGDSIDGPLNGTAPNPVRNSEFTRELGAALNRPAFLPVPAFVLKIIFGEMANVMLASQRVVPEAAAKAGFSFRYPELSLALRQILQQGRTASGAA